MAIQIPNPGTGNGQTGDNEYVLWSKVKGNFEDQTNAASRLVGTNKNNLVAVGTSGIAGTAEDVSEAASIADGLLGGSGFYKGKTHADSPNGDTVRSYYYIATRSSVNYLGMIALLASGSATSRMFLRHSENGSFRAWVEMLTSGNTTKDSNGFLKAASPIVKVFSDKIELNNDAENQNVTFAKQGIGDYTIKTISGLSTDGWYLELPKDLNGNPKVAVTLEETNGVISLKSYKRIFSMETFTFVPDLDQPLDIPDGRWIDLRLNDIEMPDILPEA